MKITYLGHAGLYIKTKDCSILCDPWKHENPQFFRSWFVYPDNSDLPWSNMIQDADFLYVSHIHHDHLDKTFLQTLADCNNDIRVILPDYRYCRLEEQLRNLGFNNFLTEGGKCGNTEFSTYPSETINREREDSSLLVNYENITFLNVNDSTITADHQRDIERRFGNIDMMACQFSGANWWPLCYDNYSDEEMKKLCLEFNNRKKSDYFRLIDRLGVKKTVTMAGPPCFLDKKLAHLNYRDNNNSIFPDCWDVSEFNTRDNIFRVMPGDEFTYGNIVDRKKRPFDKKKFLNSRIYEDDETITETEFKVAKNKFIPWIEEILESSFRYSV
jgi:UDP-MurNAc hydroxylase